MNHRTKGRRFLLQATMLGAGALLAGCSSSSTPDNMAGTPDDGGIEAASLGPCGHHACGIIAQPIDGDAGDGGDASDQ